MKLNMYILCLLRLDPELMEPSRAHEFVTSAANSQSQHRASLVNFSREPARFKTCLLKVKRLKNEEFKCISSNLSIGFDWFSISAVTSETCVIIYSDRDSDM